MTAVAIKKCFVCNCIFEPDNARVNRDATGRPETERGKVLNSEYNIFRDQPTSPASPLRINTLLCRDVYRGLMSGPTIMDGKGAIDGQSGSASDFNRSMSNFCSGSKIIKKQRGI